MTASTDSFRPARSAPFAFGEAEARASALAWIRARWLASPGLAHHARRGAIEAVFVPFWLVDAHAIAHWEGSGQRGIVEMDFGAMPICADPGTDAVLMEALEPWPMRALRPHDPGDVAARTVAQARLSADDALSLARKRMDRDLMATARHNQPANSRDRRRLTGVEFAREACVPVLLPVWRFAGARFGHLWRIAVNGATGRAAGHASGAAR